MNFEEDHEPLLLNLRTSPTKSKSKSSRGWQGLIATVSIASVIGILLFLWTATGQAPATFFKYSESHPVSANQNASLEQDPFGWSKCKGDFEFPLFQCGTLKVPLDHLGKANTNGAQLSLSLMKLTSSAPVKKGSILVNPGGPGGSGIGLVARAGLVIKTMSSGEYDIIGFDPRGIGESQSVTCFENPSLHSANDIVASTLGIPNGLDQSVSISKFNAFIQLTVQGCGRWSRDLIPFISTAYTARDMDAIRAALGEDKLNYFGFSYGTFLGITYVNMFPDRVGRVVIDGVTDPQTFAGNFVDWSLSSLVQTQDVIDGFSRLCVEAGPSKCPLSKQNDNDFSVIQRVRKFMFSLVEAPIPALSSTGTPVLLTADSVENLIFSITYSPSQWPLAASALSKSIFYKEYTALADLFSTPVDRETFCPLKDDSANFGFFSVKCADGWTDDVTTVEDFAEGAKLNSEISEFGGNAWVWTGLGCKYWPVKAVERYAGPWGNTLSNKVLLVGNTYDPVTPLASAKLAERLMNGNGVLLTHNGFGHCSIAQPSQCTMNHIRAYFSSGALPADGTICDVERGKNPFVKEGTNVFDLGMEALQAEVAKANKRVGI
ncbi:hypothetical protein BCR33DRAFT_766518 [Rhizoclosmatium globosum]|uniref:Alpha/beta-hydrolase n=1 Tax=Rhizoclosmatium globosum TaxID=329046 RepID=A0A1Y2CAA2_9FUNG|nr:hypothetical protein BCR33DRAFT_766518 [Rhizoclosmatium globosum]|eukprot:ORY43265.1 hypothetical protein BCR33DRAFT_766518 [Rhizoclosmatium globosum]